MGREGQLVKRVQNNRLVPLGLLFSWLAKESLKCGHSLYLFLPTASSFTDRPSAFLYMIMTFTYPLFISEKFTI